MCGMWYSGILFFFVNFDYEEPNSDGQLTIWQ